MKNRQNLREYGIVLILIGILNLINFITAIVDGFIENSIQAELATLEGGVLIAVEVILITLAALMALVALSDAFVGIKGIKVSANPTTEKGYIIVAKVFFVLSLVATVGAVVTLFNGTTNIAERIVTLANSVLSNCVYIIFIKAAEAVRKDAINEAK